MERPSCSVTKPLSTTGFAPSIPMKWANSWPHAFPGYSKSQSYAIRHSMPMRASMKPSSSTEVSTCACSPTSKKPGVGSRKPKGTDGFKGLQRTASPDSGSGRLCFFEAGITLKSDQHLRHRKTERPGYAPSGAMPSGKGSRFYTD